MARLEDYDDAFVAVVRKALLPEMDINRDVYISDSTGLTILKQPNGSMQPLGCPLCLIGKRGQNDLGYPTLNGRTLIAGEDAPEISTSTPLEILSNLWLCPQCRMPQEGLLPAFTGRQSIKSE